MALKCFYLRLQSGGRIRLCGGGYLRLHITCQYIGGPGKKRKRKRLPEDWWFERKVERAESIVAAQVAEAVQHVLEREVKQEAHIQTLEAEAVLREAQKRVDAKVDAESSTAKQHLDKHKGAFTALELRKVGGYSEVRTVNDLLRNIKKKKVATKAADQAIKERKGTIDEKAKKRKTALKNLEKARIAKEKKKKKEEEIRAKRLENLEKARKAKARKRKKKK